MPEPRAGVVLGDGGGAADLLDQLGCFQSQVVLKGGSVTPRKGGKREDLCAQRQRYSQLGQ